MTILFSLRLIISIVYFIKHFYSLHNWDALDGIPLEGAKEVGTRQPDKEVQLSLLIDTLNQRFATEFTHADQLFFDQIEATALEDQAIKQAAVVNTQDNFAPVLDKHLEDLFLQRMEGNEKIFMEVMNNEELRKTVFKDLLTRIYEQINQ